MDPKRTFNWLIVLAVALGLFAAPLSVPAMAAPQVAAAADGMQGMSDDMPCCPDQQDEAKDCGSCPFIALCMFTITMPVPHGAGVLADRNFSRSAFGLPDDLLIDGLGEHPPDHPPRNLV